MTNTGLLANLVELRTTGHAKKAINNWQGCCWTLWVWTLAGCFYESTKLSEEPVAQLLFKSLFNFCGFAGNKTVANSCKDNVFYPLAHG